MKSRPATRRTLGPPRSAALAECLKEHNSRQPAPGPRRGASRLRASWIKAKWRGFPKDSRSPLRAFGAVLRSWIVHQSGETDARHTQGQTMSEVGTTSPPTACASREGAERVWQPGSICRQYIACVRYWPTGHDVFPFLFYGGHASWYRCMQHTLKTLARKIVSTWNVRAVTRRADTRPGLLRQERSTFEKVADLETRLRCRECDERGRAVVSMRWGKEGMPRECEGRGCRITVGC